MIIYVLVAVKKKKRHLVTYIDLLLYTWLGNWSTESVPIGDAMDKQCGTWVDRYILFKFSISISTGQILKIWNDSIVNYCPH